MFYKYKLTSYILNAALERDIIYHVTYLANIQSISRQGLRPDLGGRYHAPAYREISRGKIFLGGDLDSARGWLYALKEHAENEQEPRDLNDPKFIPWILAIDSSDINISKDELGEGRVWGSLKTEDWIPPTHISFYSPTINRWIPIQTFSSKLAPSEFGIREYNPVEEGYLSQDEWNGEPWYEIDEEVWNSVPEAG